MILYKELTTAFTAISIIFSNATFALSLHTPVDWWHNPPKHSAYKTKQHKEVKQKKKPEPTIMIEIQHALNKLQSPNAYNEPNYYKYIKIIADNISQIPTSDLEKLPESVMLDISKYQYENHIKVTKPLVAFLYLKHPGRYKKAFWDWYTWKTQQVSILSNNMETLASLNSKMLTSTKALAQWLNKHDIAFLFFCKPENEYCQATMPAIKDMKNLGLRVKSIDVTTRPDIAHDWDIHTVPTLIALNPNTYEAAEYKGAFNMVRSVLFYFYEVFKERDNPLLYGGTS